MTFVDVLAHPCILRCRAAGNRPIEIEHQLASGEVEVEHLQPGQMLDELEVLTRSNLENTIVTDSEITRILTVPVNAFDDLLKRYPDFAPRVLELESQYLQQFVRSR